MTRRSWKIPAGLTAREHAILELLEETIEESLRVGSEGLVPQQPWNLARLFPRYRRRMLRILRFFGRPRRRRIAPCP